MKPEKKIAANGAEHWYLNGRLHREDGPAKICPDGEKQWWLYGFLHRVDGPAMIGPGGYQEVVYRW